MDAKQFVKDNEYAVFIRMFMNQDPFNAISNAIKMKKHIQSNKRTDFDSTYGEESKNIIDLYDKFFFLDNMISKAKMIQIDKDLMPSIINTDNEIFYRQMGLPVMFINETFEVDDNLIKGILVADADELMHRADPDIQAEMFVQNSMRLWEKNILFLALVLPSNPDHYLKGESWFAFTIDNYKQKYDTRAAQNLCKTIMTLSMNVLDVMNHDVETIDINTIISTREENDKRIRRGKPPVPTKVYIRPKSEHRTYYVTLNEQVRNIGHRFIVRGHWRHFRSEKWKNKKGQSTWIKMQVRGKGLLIEKKYQLED